MQPKLLQQNTLSNPEVLYTANFLVKMINVVNNKDLWSENNYSVKLPKKKSLSSLTLLKNLFLLFFSCLFEMKKLCARYISFTLSTIFIHHMAKIVCLDYNPNGVSGMGNTKRVGCVPKNFQVN